jgi:hypothetical protein
VARTKRRYEEKVNIEEKDVAGDAKGVSRGLSKRPNKPTPPEPHQEIGQNP